VKDCADCPTLVVVPAGYFHSAVEASLSSNGTFRNATTSPTRIDRFALAKMAVTVGAYDKFITASGHARPACAGALDGDRSRPMTCVSFTDAYAYASWLRGQSGQTYRLPSAAEWEYASRTSPADEPTLHAPTAGRISSFGAHSMGGVVAELVTDCWLGTGVAGPTDGSAAWVDGGCRSRTLMGYAATEPAPAGTAALRREIAMRTARPDVGFRLAREISEDVRN
jgi:formylglycine-generating enzyme required for sulfatase activity